MEKLRFSIDRNSSCVDELTTYSNDLIKALTESTTITLDELNDLADSLRAAYADSIKVDSGSSGQSTRIISHLLSVVESMIYRSR